MTYDRGTFFRWTGAPQKGLHFTVVSGRGLRRDHAGVAPQLHRNGVEGPRAGLPEFILLRPG
jgi:hypothetical protein